MFDKIKSHAKINLALNITGKSKSLHKIESIIAFVTLHDEIYIKQINKQSHQILPARLSVGQCCLLSHDLECISFGNLGTLGSGSR